MNRLMFFIGLILALAVPANAQVRDVAPGIYSQGFFSTPNYVRNPNCFANTVNVTASGGSLTRTTTTPVFGSASCLIDASASAQTYKFATNTLDNGLNGQNCEARFTYTGDASLYKAYVEQPAGTKVSQEVTLVNAGSGSRTVSAIYPCGSNSNATFLTIEATSASAAAIRVGQAYVGQAVSVSNSAISIVTRQRFTSGSGTYTTPAGVRYIEVEMVGGGGGGSGSGTASQGSGGNGGASTFGSSLLTANGGDGGIYLNGFGGPGGSVTINAPAIAIADSSGQRGGNGFIPTSASDAFGGGSGGSSVLGGGGGGYNANVGLGGSGYGAGGGGGGKGVGVSHNSGNGGGGGGYIKAQINNPSATYAYSVGAAGAAGAAGTSGLAGGAGSSGLIIVTEYYDQVAVRADQTNYDWTSYTPTPTGFGTASNYECQHKRSGSDLLLRCKFTTGTPTATEARVSLPGSLITDPARVPSIQMCGDAVRSAAAGSAQRYLTTCEASAAYVTFVLQSTSSGGLTKALANAIAGAAESWNFTARVPISGWTESQNAPILVGSVTSGSAGAERVERAIVTCSSSSSITSQSGSWLSSIGNVSSGACVLTIAGGIFSAAPTCTVSTNSNDSGFLVGPFSLSSSATSVTVGMRYITGGSATVTNIVSQSLAVICMGPR